MKKERRMWLAYEQEKGFIRKNGTNTLDFSKARIYTGKGHLKVSVGKAKLERGDVVAVPVDLVIDEEILLILRLGGQPYEG